MKKSISLIIILSVFCCICSARGKADIEIPTEEVEYALKGDEASVLQEEEKPLQPLYSLRQPTGKPLQLRESWGYVMQSRLDEYDNSIPLTDVCFFSAEVNCMASLRQFLAATV